jgi:hypothetical protein
LDLDVFLKLFEDPHLPATIAETWLLILQRNALKWPDHYDLALIRVALDCKDPRPKLHLLRHLNPHNPERTVIAPWWWEIHPELSWADFRWLIASRVPTRWKQEAFYRCWHLGTNPVILQNLTNEMDFDDELSRYLLLFQTFWLNESRFTQLIQNRVQFPFFRLETVPRLQVVFYSFALKSKFFRRIRQLHLSHLVGYIRHTCLE